MKLFTITCFLLHLRLSQQHGRMLEPPGRSSMWRVGFPTPKNENDNALYCGGFGVQYNLNGGKCGICGDPWNVWPRQNEAPHGVYATGIISKTYRQGSIIPVVVDITANHQGHFTFKLCPNNDIWQDPKQDCFDRYVLRTGKDAVEKYYISDYTTGLRLVYVHLPAGLSCSQCILQWTYTAGNNWGLCSNGTGTLGCGNQETFRSCSDIRILPRHSSSSGRQETNTFSQETTFDIDQFEDYYDELFNNQNNNIAINNVEVAIDEDHGDNEIATMHSVQSKRLRLLKKKLILAKALKSLRKLIMLSKLKGDEAESSVRVKPRESFELYDEEERLGRSTSTVMPWWARSNSHGRKKRKRKKRYSFWYDVFH